MRLRRFAVGPVVVEGDAGVDVRTGDRFGPFVEQEAALPRRLREWHAEMRGVQQAVVIEWLFRWELETDPLVAGDEGQLNGHEKRFGTPQAAGQHHDLFPRVHLLAHARDAVQPGIDRKIFERLDCRRLRRGQMREQRAGPAVLIRVATSSPCAALQRELGNDDEVLAEQRLGGDLRARARSRDEAAAVYTSYCAALSARRRVHSRET